MNTFDEELIDEIEDNESIETIDEANEDELLDITDDSEFYKEGDVEFDNYDDLLVSQSSNVNQDISVTDPVRMFLKEIGSVNLLSKEEEYNLAKTIFDTRVIIDEFLEKTSTGYEPSDEEIEEIKGLTIKLEKAKKTLSEANLRLVVNIAKYYSNHNMEFADLIQEGYIGLSKAVVKFDYRLGNKFSTYATGWIKQAITRAIADQSRTIRIPVHMNETINKLNKKESELTYNLGRKPTMEELADAMELPLNKIIMIKMSSLKTKSLEDKVGDDEDSTYGDFISDNENPNPEEYTIKEAQKTILDNLLTSLSEKEERVLRLRFGLLDGRSRTLEEVGDEFQLTRERIRQIESKALKKLRRLYQIYNLKDELK